MGYSVFDLIYNLKISLNVSMCALLLRLCVLIHLCLFEIVHIPNCHSNVQMSENSE